MNKKEWLRQHQGILAWFLLLLVMGLTYFVLDQLVIERYRTYTEKIGELRKNLESFKQASVQRSVVEAQLQRVQTNSTSKISYLNKATAALAAAELQVRVKRAVESSGGKLVSTQILTEDRSDTFPRVAVKVRVTGPMDTVQRLFHNLESGDPQLFINNVTIQSRSVRRRIPRQRIVKQITEMDLNFNLSGYMREEAS